MATNLSSLPTTSSPAVEVEVQEDATYVFVDGEFAGSVTPAYTLGDCRAVVYGWFVFDEREGAVIKSYGVQSSRRFVAEQRLVGILGLPGNLRDYRA